MPSVSDFEKSILALMMWREEGPDGIQGMVATGLVIRNRVNAGWSGGDWLAVMTKSSKPIRTQSYSLDIVWPDIRDPLFQSVLRRAEKIYDGSEPDITGGALFYADLADPALSESFKVQVLGNPDAHPRIGTVGRRTFFK